jgi:hypothetical protein
MDLPATGWRLPDKACELLASLVAEHRPELVVECGSGRSTVVLADAAAEYGGRVVALEHDREFAKETRWMMLDHRGVVDVRWGWLEDGWYPRFLWEDLHGIGMLVVDGPPGGIGRYARQPALPLLRDRLLPGCVVVLDDCDRPDEQQIMRDWGLEWTLVEHEKATIGWAILP